jgi:hypothetical protein
VHGLLFVDFFPQSFEMMKANVGSGGTVKLVALVQFVTQESAERFLATYHRRTIENFQLSVNYIPAN